MRYMSPHIRGVGEAGEEKGEMYRLIHKCSACLGGHSCVCVYVHVCVHICACLCMCPCVYMCTPCVYMCAHVYMYVYMYVHAFVLALCVCMHVCLHVYVHMHAFSSWLRTHNPPNPSSAIRIVFPLGFAAQNPQWLTLAYGIKCT